MLSFFRNLSKSKVGVGIIGVVLLLILVGFAMQDISSLFSGTVGMNRNTLAKVGSQQITDKDVDSVMQRYLDNVRQQKPQATYADIAGDFDALLESVIDSRALAAFAERNRFMLSKRLVDAQITQIPGTRGLDGKFSEAAYQALLANRRLTDAEVRQELANGLLQKLIIQPVIANPAVPVGMARPYADMFLEARQGEVALIPVETFRAGLSPTEADLRQFYAANRGRYMVPEQRVLKIARIGPEQVANVVPSEQEIAAYYKANQATFGAKDKRVLSHAVVPDQRSAQAIAARARGGTAFAAAAGGVAASLGEQTRDQYASIAGAAAANAAFSARQGEVVGPVRSDLGWIVVKVEGIKQQPGKTLAQARGEILAGLAAAKRKGALEELVAKVQEAIDGGGNLDEAAAVAKAPVVQTPAITANGQARGDPGYKFPPDLAPALKSGFDLDVNEAPLIDQLPAGGYALVAASQVIASAPAPFESVRARIAEQWLAAQAASRAKAVASAITAKVARGVPLAQAVRESGAALPPVQPLAARRIQLQQLGANVPAPLKMLFSLAPGGTRMVADPQGRGFFVLKVTRATPGNSLASPGLINRIQQEFRQPLSGEYGREFIAAVRKSVGVRKNDALIAETKRRYRSAG